MSNTLDVVVTRNVWKIFGERAEAAIEVTWCENLSKAKILAQYQSVIGPRDVSFSVDKGDIFCIMELSGS